MRQLTSHAHLGKWEESGEPGENPHRQRPREGIFFPSSHQCYNETSNKMTLFKDLLPLRQQVNL